MSLILEALRKSEAERRRGLPPDLRSELPPPAPARMRRAPAWIALAAAIAALALGWLLWPRPAATPETEPPARDGTSTATSQTQAADATDAVGRDAALPAMTTTPAPPASPQTMTGTAGGQPPSAASAPPPPAQARAPDVPAAPTPPVATAPAPTAPDIAIPASPVPAPAVTPGRVTALADLDPETRKALPPLRLSMHMWNEVPARRFAIVDGKRVAEGDRIGEATVTRIEPDGLLLEWRGTGLRVPLR